MENTNHDNTELNMEELNDIVGGKAPTEVTLSYETRNGESYVNLNGANGYWLCIPERNLGKYHEKYPDRVIKMPDGSTY